MKQSIVFRGSICSDRYKTNFLKHSVSELRKWFSGEIIISTWIGQEENAECIDGVDGIVYTEDPGPGLVAHNRRQHISFREGVRASSGGVVFVTRPDCLLTKDPFYLMDCNQVCDNRFRFVQTRMVAGNMMTFSPSHGSSPSEKWEGYFRLGDWFHMGMRQDILLWGDVLQFSETMNCTPDGIQIPNRSVEQLWLMSAINKYSIDKIDVQQYQFMDANNAWAGILNNFRVVNTRSTAGVYNLNWNHQSEFHPLYMTEHEYEHHFLNRYGTSVKG